MKLVLSVVAALSMVAPLGAAGQQIVSSSELTTRTSDALVLLETAMTGSNSSDATDLEAATRRRYMVEEAARLLQSASTTAGASENLVAARKEFVQAVRNLHHARSSAMADGMFEEVIRIDALGPVIEDLNTYYMPTR